MQKTIAMKLLEGKKVTYETAVYPATMRDAAEIAAVFEVSPGQVFKTLVVAAPAPNLKPMLVMVPADRHLNLKKLARIVNVKKLKMATHAEAERLTGLQVGGISALALINKGFAIFLDASAQSWPRIYVSAGKKGINLLVPVAGLIKVTGARPADVSD